MNFFYRDDAHILVLLKSGFYYKFKNPTHSKKRNEFNEID